MTLLFRVTLACTGIPEASGVAGAVEVRAEFENRPWHRNANAWWQDGVLFLSAENDYDPMGTALLDEFSDAIVACVELESNDIAFRIESIVPFEEGTRFDSEKVVWVKA